MTRALQRRFVAAAMLSLLVLLCILIGGITAVSYVLMERNTDSTLEFILSDAPPPAPDERERRPMFGYQVTPNPPMFSGHVLVTVGEGGSIQSMDMGFNPSDDEATLRAYVGEVLAGGKAQGKIGAYKYRRVALAGGGSKIAFLNVSVQAQMLGSTVRSASLIGLLCMGLMFIILLVVSRRTVQPIARNIEKQRRFVTDAGHEIKTPLAIIQANTDALELHLGKNKWSGHIREQTLRLDGLMRQLLSLSKMDETGSLQALEDVPLSEMLEKNVAAYADGTPQKQICANITPRVVVRGSREGLAQLISILLDNAVKYSGEEGRIAITLSQPGKRPVLEVANTCASLPEAEPQALFDRFYRADAARTQQGGGYGIGLSIAQAIVEQHKGKIAAFYDDAHTVRFRVEF